MGRESAGGRLPRSLAAGVLALATATAPLCASAEAVAGGAAGRGGVHRSFPGAGFGCGAGVPQAEVVRSGGRWTVRQGGGTVYAGGAMLTALRVALRAAGSPHAAGRAAPRRVVVRGSGAMPAGQSLDLPPHTVLELCGTIAPRRGRVEPEAGRRRGAGVAWPPAGFGARLLPRGTGCARGGVRRSASVGGQHR